MRAEPENRAAWRVELDRSYKRFAGLLLAGAAAPVKHHAAIRTALAECEASIERIERILAQPWRCTLPREYAFRHVMEWHASHLSQAGAYRRSCRRAAARRFRDIEMARGQLELARQGRLAAPYRRLP